jgi:hypothetical protein
MEWVLIFWLFGELHGGERSGGGPNIATFSTKESCEAAGDTILKAPRFRGRQSLIVSGNYVCVPR